MSALQPIVNVPYPNFPMDDELDPNRVVPVEGVTAPASVREVEAPENRPPGEEIIVPDAAEMSAASIALSQSRARQQEDDTFDPTAMASRIRDNLSVRELILSFDNYDNAMARKSYENYLRLFVNIAPEAVETQAGDAVMADIRSRENALYAALGFMPANLEPDTTAYRERMALAIDSWFAGNGVFVPSMLDYSSSDGFRFTPLTAQSRAATRAADTLSSYERTRIAQYLREMARLTPNDFMFYDPTGLGALPLEQRRQFLERVDQLLDQEGIDQRAADLQYTLDENNRLRIDDMELLEEDERRRLEALEESINSYYAMLLASVQQYSAGVISASLA